jgi:hypothetical protein
MKHLLHLLLFVVTLSHTQTLRAQYADTATDNPGKAAVATAPIKQGQDEVTVYPNPAFNELNIVYGTNADVKNIAVYNLIGKLITIYKAAEMGSANLNIENIPGGVYYVWLVNSRGDVIATKKFTKH